MVCHCNALICGGPKSRYMSVILGREVFFSKSKDVFFGNSCRAHFQCDGKKTDFFLIILDLAIAIMLLSALATIGFQVWLHFLR